jgi:hypothetical protein
METQLDATYLRPRPVHRAAAVGFGAIGIGIGVFLAAWGISFLWHPAQDHRIEALTAQLETLSRKVTDGFDAVPQKLSGLDTIIAKLESLSQNVEGLDRHVGALDLKTAPPVYGGSTGGGKTPDGDIIKTEVTVFSNVDHAPGSVITGWRYNDGASANSKPMQQFCYYTTPSLDGTSTRTDLAYDGNRIYFSGVPRAEDAVRKCHWWAGS